MDGKRISERLWVGGYGWLPVLAGADKFTNHLTDWERSLAPWVKRRLPVRARTFLRVLGVLEMLVGLSLLARPTRRWGARVASGWLGVSSLHGLSTGRRLDVAARDAVLALGAWRLSRPLPTPKVTVVQVTEVLELPDVPERTRFFARLDCDELTALVPVQ